MSPDEPASKRRKEFEETGGSVYAGTNAVPRTGSPGRVLHLGLADGELANRVVVVGSPARARLLAENLEPEEPGKPLFERESDRGFLTFTGKHAGARVSVVSIGMGLAMMDFFVREGRAVVKGPMAVVRFGTCGVLQESVPVGTISVAKEGSICVRRNFAAFANGGDGKNGNSPYDISDVCAPDASLTAVVTSELEKEMGKDMIAAGINVTADSFYGSQGRVDPCFRDANDNLIDQVLAKHPSALSCEMESFLLLHLAQSCVPQGDMRAAAAVVNVANRPTGAVVGEEGLRDAERKGGLALVRAVATLSL